MSRSCFLRASQALPICCRGLNNKINPTAKTAIKATTINISTRVNPTSPAFGGIRGASAFFGMLGLNDNFPEDILSSHQTEAGAVVGKIISVTQDQVGVGGNDSFVIFHI